MRSVWAIWSARVWPSQGLPGRLLAPSTNCPPGATALVVARETFTPNPKRACALPLPMHSTSLRRVQRVRLVAAAVLAPLPQQPRDEAERPGEGGPGRRIARDLAADVPEQAPEPGAPLPDLPPRMAG